MSLEVLKVEISAENREQADDILNSLFKKRLVTGGQILTAPARFLWKGKAVDMDYITMVSFTVTSHKEAIIADVRSTSKEEVPMIWFTEIDTNTEFEKWIIDTVT